MLRRKQLWPHAHASGVPEWLLYTLMRALAADMPEETALRIEETSKERLQDLTKALCLNTEVHSTAYTTALVFGWLSASGLLQLSIGLMRGSAQLCQAWKCSDFADALPACRPVRGYQGRPSKPCPARDPLLEQPLRSCRPRTLHWVRARATTRPCLQGAPFSSLAVARSFCMAR